jgi:hypothetical protein
VPSRHKEQECSELVELFVHLDEVDNLYLGLIKHAELHWMEAVGHWEVAHNTENMSKDYESSAYNA